VCARAYVLCRRRVCASDTREQQRGDFMVDTHKLSATGVVWAGGPPGQ